MARKTLTTVAMTPTPPTEAIGGMIGEAINRLAVCCSQFDNMQSEERKAALRFIVSKYGLYNAFAVIVQETREH